MQKHIQKYSCLNTNDYICSMNTNGKCPASVRF